MKVTSSLFLYLRDNNLEFGRECFCLLSTLRVIKEIWFIRWSLKFFWDLATLYLTKKNFHYSCKHASWKSFLPSHIPAHTARQVTQFMVKILSTVIPAELVGFINGEQKFGNLRDIWCRKSLCCCWVTAGISFPMNFCWCSMMSSCWLREAPTHSSAVSYFHAKHRCLHDESEQISWV